MSFDTYSDLKTTVIDWVNNSTVAGQIDALINLAERDMRRKLRCWWMEKRYDLTLVVNQTVYDLPSDYLQWARFLIIDTDDELSIQKTKPLKYVSSQALEGRYFEDNEDIQDYQNTPTHFTIVEKKLKLIPIPNLSYTTIMTYYYKDTELSSSNETNYFTENAADCLLYGTLVHASPYLKDDDRTSLWAEFYKNYLTSIQEDSDKARSGDSGPNMEVEGIGIPVSPYWRTDL